VNFTAWWPALGPESGPWLVVSQQYSPTMTMSNEYDWNLAGAPYGEVKISFDVYDEGGTGTWRPMEHAPLFTHLTPIPPVRAVRGASVNGPPEEGR